MIRKTSLCSGWEVEWPQWFAPAGRTSHPRREWLPANVPGHVHLDLVRAGVIADPFVGLAELGCEWVDSERWSYRTTFAFEPDPNLGRRLLQFAGLDTLASVWLDGTKIGESDDMFVPLEIDVTERLAGGTHELRVDLESALIAGRERRAAYLAAENVPETVLRFDERAFVRKAQYMYGWDWGPRRISAGIWQPVTLVEHEGRLLDVHVQQRHLPDGSVELCCSSEIEGAGEVVHFIGQSGRVVRDGELTRIAEPQLWWPAGLGPQPLLMVRSYLTREIGLPPDVLEHAALDLRKTRIGLRRVRLLRQPDRYGESFEFEVNGRRVWCHGANWIPDHSFPSVVTPSRVREQVARARDMNMNMLRVWGGGLYESDDFYDACDELGVLVWQDFPYACNYYPEDSKTLDSARRQARVNVKRLRNHPSLVLWCGNNENRTMFESKWEDETRHPTRYYGEKIFDEVLPGVLAELDSERPYLPSSPWGGQNANDGGIGDQHFWGAWHEKGDWKHYEESTARFASEFGFASAPSPRAWRRMMPRELEHPMALDVRHPVARWHDKTLKGYDVFLGLVELHYPAATSIEEWLYYSQLNQRDALRHAIEHFRRSEFCKGALIWQLNDCWPVQSWAVLDSEAEYKAAAYELRRLFAPLLLSIVVNDQKAALWGILDNSETTASGTATLEVRSLLTGRSLQRSDAHVELQPGDRRMLLQLDLATHEPREALLTAKFADATATRLLSEPKLARLPRPHLTATAGAGGLLVTSDVPVVDLFLWDPTNEVRFLDNFVTLPAGGGITLRLSGRAASLRARSMGGPHAVELRGT